MKLSIFTFTLVLLASLTLNAQVFEPDFSTSLDVENGKALMQQCSRSTPSKISDYWEVTEADISTLEQNYKKLTSLKSSGCCINGQKISALEDYGYQYIGVTIRNRRYIYINAFHVDSKPIERWYKNWETKPVIFCDGGESFWGVLFDLKKKKFKQLHVNGI